MELYVKRYMLSERYDDMNTKKFKNMAITSLVMLGVMLLITIAFIILFKVAGKQIEEETDNFTVTLLFLVLWAYLEDLPLLALVSYQLFI